MVNKNPLQKRHLRELRSEPARYLSLLLLLILSIGFVSGFLVADNSMIAAYEESFTRYNIEDGHFSLENKANKAQLKGISQDGKVDLFELFYTERAFTNGSTIRLYKNRGEVDLACVMQGRLPEAPGEIAVDRMYADNNNLKTGDMLTVEEDGRSWIITGLVALSDYSCLFQNNSDSMFDALTFGVGVIPAEEFDGLDTDRMVWNYAWKYHEPPADEAQEVEVSDDLMQVVLGYADLRDFIPRYVNRAINFTGDDMGSDKAMMLVLLYMIIAILAFMFAILTSGTITREAAVIGTLRASGCIIGELLRHYMALPLFITLLGAALGNLLGYTVLKNLCAYMYYYSYSLPTYVTIWNGEAFVLTTLVPASIMVVITFCILRRALSLSPLRFIRRDLSRRKHRRAFPLPSFLPFFSRFRLRVLLQNLPGYLTIFVGILFANLLLMFGLALPDVMDSYQAEIQTNLLADYIYMLSVPPEALDENHRLLSFLSMLRFADGVSTENEDAEKFTAWSLQTTYAEYPEESILIYGVAPDSRYIDVDAGGPESVFISSAYAEKYLLKIGDTVTLKEKYEDTSYTFTVAGVYDYAGGLVIFMDQAALNGMLDMGGDYFSGYFSSTPITDIDARYMGGVVDLNALTKISRQLTHSMGDMMGLVNGFSVIIFIIVVYLLSKSIIEKNAQSISMSKILGYTDGEIASLYIMTTTVVVFVSILASFPILSVSLTWIFRVMLMQMLSGWLPLTLRPSLYLRMFAIGMGTYLVVALLEFRKIKHVPMDEALKNVE